MRGAISAVRSWFSVGRPIAKNKSLKAPAGACALFNTFELVTRVKGEG
jgi:hypothetical protein